MIGGNIAARNNRISGAVAARSSSIRGSIRASNKGFAPPAPSGRVTGVPPLSFTASAGSLTDYRINGSTSGSSGVGDLSGSSYIIPITLNNTTKNLALSMPLYSGDWVRKTPRHNYFGFTNNFYFAYPSGISCYSNGTLGMPQSRSSIPLRKLFNSTVEFNTFVKWSNTSVAWDFMLHGAYRDGTPYDIADGTYKLRATLSIPPYDSSLNQESPYIKTYIYAFTSNGSVIGSLMFTSETNKMLETTIEISENQPLTGLLLRFESTQANRETRLFGTTISVGLFDADDNEADVSPSGETNVTSYFRKVTYTGASNEEWEYFGNGVFLAGVTTAANNKIVLGKPRGIIYCSDNTFDDMYISEQNVLHPVKRSLTSVSAMRSYLSSNPMTIIYETVTPYGESPEMPALTTAEGSNTLSVGTTVQPSSVTLVGEGIQG